MSLFLFKSKTIHTLVITVELFSVSIPLKKLFLKLFFFILCISYSYYLSNTAMYIKIAKKISFFIKTPPFLALIGCEENNI